MGAWHAEQVQYLGQRLTWVLHQQERGRSGTRGERLAERQRRILQLRAKQPGHDRRIITTAFIFALRHCWLCRDAARDVFCACQAVIDKDYVAMSHTDIFDQLALWGLPDSRETERKGQGVFHGPCDLNNRSVIQLIYNRRHVRQAHSTAMFMIGVGGIASFGAEHLFKNEY